ncbi:hypothetical protein Avbf_16666 [Armadillidium vulgare]|nr:hypothetical protein Avbf_16666 [Armadillidium vulgare]
MMNFCHYKRKTMLLFLAILSIFFISFGKDKIKQFTNSMKGILLNVNNQTRYPYYMQYRSCKSGVPPEGHIIFFSK